MTKDTKCKHLICDIIATYGHQANDLKCRKCKAEFKDSYQEGYGFAVGSFGHPEHVMYYGGNDGDIIRIIMEYEGLTDGVQSKV